MEYPGVAFVTGAASGIGRATAILFAARGCQRIVLTDKNLDGLHETQTMIRQRYQSVSALVVQTDVRDERSVQELVAHAVSEFGRIDYCCNVAGITLAGETAESTTADFELQYQINLRGVYFCERAELQAMLKQDSLTSAESDIPVKGTIVNVASLAGLMAYPDLPAYAAFKHAVIGLSKSDAMRAVLTPLTANMSRSHLYEAAIQSTGLRRAGKPEELAEALVWLCSGRSAFVNGIALSVNGGRNGL
ncbi:hypothetical protein CLAIMM_09761 [Cladophialophora immunda]|nr:hypothetical protein CLAIMM_09761 [Cladophialophora immunda]